jgi:hypothetical protein
MTAVIEGAMEPAATSESAKAAKPLQRLVPHL